MPASSAWPRLAQRAEGLLLCNERVLLAPAVAGPQRGTQRQQACRWTLVPALVLCESISSVFVLFTSCLKQLLTMVRPQETAALRRLVLKRLVPQRAPAAVWRACSWGCRGAPAR